MRLEKSTKNIKYNIIFFIISGFLMFFSRSIFLKQLGSEITGLNSLFSSIIGFLNLAELGIVNVIVYSLYKPIYDNNKEKIKDIIKLYKYIYIIIGILVLILGLILSNYLQYFVNYNLNYLYVKNNFIIYLLTVSLSYFFTSKYSIVVADQNSYIITKIEGCYKILKSLIQIIVIMYVKSYSIWLLIELIFNILGYIHCNYIINKKYSWINEFNKKSIKTILVEYGYILKNTKNMFFHKIGSFVVFQTDNLLIAKYINLNIVTIYNNYYMVFSLASNIMAQIFNGLGASIGSFIEEKTDEDAYNLWNMLQSINMFITVVFITCIYLRIDDFIILWVGNKYLLDKNIIYVLLINLYFLLMRGSIGKFKDAYGIFWDKYIPIIEASINLIISWILVVKFGLIGVIIGTLLSNIFVMLFWTPYIVFKKGFKKNPLIYHIKNSKLILRATIPILFTILFNNILENLLKVISITNFLTLLFLNFVSISILYLLCLLKEEGVKLLINRFKVKEKI